MQKFHFKLQKILGLKEREEDESRIQFQQAQASYEAERKRMETLQRKCEISRVAYRDAQMGQIDITRVQHYQRYIYQLEREIESASFTVEELRGRLNVAQEHLLNAVQERKKIEKLKDRHIQYYHEELKRVEQQEIDEMATCRSFGR